MRLPMQSNKCEEEGSTHLYLSHHLPDSIIRYEVFSFVPTEAYFSLLLSCSTLNAWLRESNWFKYWRLLNYCYIWEELLNCDNVQDTQNKDMNASSSLPQLDFFSSTMARNLHNISFKKSAWTYSIPEQVFTIYDDEPLCRELMKLFRFCVYDLKEIPWFQQDYNDLKTIQETTDDEYRMELIKQYVHYIPTAEYKILDRLNCLKAVCRRHAKDISDRQVLLATVKHADGTILSYTSFLKRIQPQFLSDKEIVMRVVSQSLVPDLCYASEELRNDKEVVLTAVRTRPNSLEFASDELRRDRDVCLAAVESDYSCLNESFFHEPLKNDPEFAWECVILDGRCLEYLADEFKSDRKYVLAALKSYGMALKCLSRELRNDKEIVSIAVHETFFAFEYASEELQDDMEFISTLTRENIGIVQFASPRLRNHKDFIISILRGVISKDVLPCIIAYVVDSLSDTLRDDEEVIKFALSLSSRPAY